jgi:hypothetical protein
MNFYELASVKHTEVFELLGTNQQGLSAMAAGEKLLSKIGPNELQEGKKKSIRRYAAGPV